MFWLSIKGFQYMKSRQGRSVCQAGVAEGCRGRANSAGKVGESAKMVPVSPCPKGEF